MGLVAPRFAHALLVAVVALAVGATSAQAVTYNFTVSPSPPNEDALTTFQLTPTSSHVNAVFWDLDGDGSFDDGTARSVTRTYANRGSVTVRMAARDTSRSNFQVVTKTITVNGRPAADFGFTRSQPLAGESVAFTPAVTDPEGDAVTLSWDFGDGKKSSVSAPSHSFAAAGTYEVVLTATDKHGAATEVAHEVTVAADPGPTAAFEYSPANPRTGDAVRFTSTSTPSQGDVKTTEWDLDGDGEYDETGSQVTWSFTEAGVHRVTMRVTQDNGKRAVAFDDVNVAERPAPPPPPPQPIGPDQPAGGGPEPTAPGGGSDVIAPAPRPKRATRMRPFPVVRIAGVVLPRGALVKILSVRAAQGAKVVVRCRGRGCPVGVVARSSVASLVRFHRFERRLRAGTVLELFVRKANKIGKYTRFLIRAGKPPARVDRCLMPGRARPVRCA
jgi:PKD repeat protein